MTCQKQPGTEQRSHRRYHLKQNIFAALAGYSVAQPVRVVDLSPAGIGLSASTETPLPGKQLTFDLVSENGGALLCSLTAQVAFVHRKKASASPDQFQDAPLRYGLKFIYLTRLQEKQLDLLTRKYGCPAAPASPVPATTMAALSL